MTESKYNFINPESVPKSDRNLDNYYELTLLRIVDYAQQVIEISVRNQYENEPVQYLEMALPGLKTISDYGQEIMDYMKTLESRLATANET